MAPLALSQDTQKWMVPFALAMQSVMEMMLGSRCDVGEFEQVGTERRQWLEVTSVISLSGELQGALSFSTTRVGALDVLNRMAGIEADELNHDVCDGIGEIANMVAGFGKRELALPELKLGLPQVIVGEGISVFSPRWPFHYRAPLETDIGPCLLDVGFSPAQH